MNQGTLFPLEPKPDFAKVDKLIKSNDNRSVTLAYEIMKTTMKLPLPFILNRILQARFNWNWEQITSDAISGRPMVYAPEFRIGNCPFLIVETHWGMGLLLQYGRMENSTADVCDLFEWGENDNMGKKVQAKIHKSLKKLIYTPGMSEKLDSIINKK